MELSPSCDALSWAKSTVVGEGRTYRGHPEGVVVGHDDNGGEVLAAQPGQPPLWKDSVGRGAGAQGEGDVGGSPCALGSSFPRTHPPGLRGPQGLPELGSHQVKP